MRAVVALAFLVTFASGANAREPELPVPPIPPASPPTIAAPVPDRDLPGRNEPVRSSAVTLDTDINHRAAPAPGLGYSKGAAYQIDNDRRWLVLPGVMVHVPLP